MYGREQLVLPSHSAFIPWGEGHRVCPGQKFVQVKHVAVVVAVFRDHCVAPLRRFIERQEAARKSCNSLCARHGHATSLADAPP